MKESRRNKSRDLPFGIFIGLCSAAILACAIYLFYNYWYLPRKVEDKNQKYEALYHPGTEESATPEVTEAMPTQAASAMPTATAVPTVTPTAEPSATPEILPSPDVEAISDASPQTPEPAPIVFAVPTTPPVRERFHDLLAVNPETVGFLTVGEIVSLPVVQRVNDNEFYLKHDFEGAKSNAGTLFLDGVNRLEYDDPCLILYGHNMKNGTMFGHLPNFVFKSVLTKNAIAQFDTLYEDRTYTAFACFALTADQSESEYIELRKFQFSEEQFEDYIARLKKESLFDIPVDVQYGDDILLLITCNYNMDDGRFVVALRELREGESEEELRARVGQAVEK